jgi:hypothetical protein
MDIHIHHTIEFEKIKDWKGAISLTRKRMAIQQLLDSHESEAMLIQHLTSYVSDFDNTLAMLTTNRHIPLESTPLFSWTVDNSSISSSCWKTEAVLSRLALANLLLQAGTTQLPDYKMAATTFAKSIKCHQEIIRELSTWKWKTPQHNHFFLQTDWHKASIAHLDCLRHCCMVSVGIAKNLPAKTLYTVAQRAVQSAAESIGFWTDVQPNILPLCETLRYYYSANILWDNAQYGSCIYTMQRWLTNPPTNSAFDNVNTELDKIEFLLKERERTNNGAYFDTVVAPTPLPTPLELLGTTDVKHPIL